VGCIAQRRRTFLERHEWQTIRWARMTAPKATWIRLQDIMCRVPGLMEDADGLGTRDVDEPGFARLQGAIMATLREVETLRACWELEHPDAPCCVAPREPDSPFGFVYHFPTFDMASEAVHFHVVTLLLYGLAQQTGLHLGQSGPANGIKDAQFHALSICQSIQYMIESSDHGSLGAWLSSSRSGWRQVTSWACLGRQGGWAGSGGASLGRRALTSAPGRWRLEELA
jgi:hypothetical protein